MVGPSDEDDLRLARLMAAVPEASVEEFKESLEAGAESHCIVSQRACDIPPEHRIEGAVEGECDGCGELICLSPTSQKFVALGARKVCARCMLVETQKLKPEELRISSVPGARAEIYRHFRKGKQ